jgi:glycosyltransferase involved in cell wall biosynthesis
MASQLRDRSIGAVIPAYEAAGTLAGVLKGMARSLPPERILVVDDGSSDATAEIAGTLGVSFLRHERNRGKGSALMSGFLQARRLDWEWILTVDADGQHAPEDVEGFLDCRPGEGTGILVGRRVRSGSMPLHRRFSNAFTTWMVSRLAGRPVFDAQSGFRAYRAELADWLPREGRFEWESQALVICSRRGYGVEAVPVRTLYRGAGSHMRLGRDTWRFLRMAGRLAWTR